MYWALIVILYLVLIVGAWQLLCRSRKEHEAEVDTLKQEIARLREKLSLLTSKPEEETTTSPDDLFLKEVQTRVNEAIDAGDISVDSVALRMNLGTQTFRRRLQNAAGISPKEYILSLQMRKAAGMLLMQKDVNIQEIGRNCGFEDASSFNHAFKRIYGCSPGQYRDGLIENNKPKAESRIM